MFILLYFISRLEDKLEFKNHSKSIKFIVKKKLITYIWKLIRLVHAKHSYIKGLLKNNCPPSKKN
jgi:hypothetical protein